MIRYILCSTVLAAMLVQPLAAQESKLSADLAAVPGEAIGFLHVRVGDLWKSDAFKDMRAMIAKAGPKAFEAFDSRFVPAPSTIDRITLIGIMPANPANEPPIVVIVGCNASFDKAKMVKSLLPAGKEIKAGDGVFFADEDLGLAIRAIDDETVAFASVDIMRQFVEMKTKAPHPFASALSAAAAKRHLVLALNASMLPNEVVAELPEPLQPLARVKMAQLALDIGIYYTNTGKRTPESKGPDE